MLCGYPRMLGYPLLKRSSGQLIDTDSACRTGGGVFIEMLRRFLAKGLATVAAVALAAHAGAGAAPADGAPLKIGIIELVGAFNAINSGDLSSKAHRSGEPIAIPLAGDDAEALAVAQRLVRDAGFEPVVVGPLSRAHEFDVGTPVYTRIMTAPQLRQALGLK